MEKTCKQCGRTLPVDSFRKYSPRGKGIYRTAQGHHTICKDCEAISARAATAIRNGDGEAIKKLSDHYRSLQGRGFEPVTKPARQLLGVDSPKPRRRDTLDALLSSVSSYQESSHMDEALQRHCDLVRTRGYESAAEADEAHRLYAESLKQLDEDLYTEITDLVDDWYMEED